MSRSASSARNLVVAMIGQAIGIIISFFSRMVFVKILGSEYLGIDGLFTNILTILSLAELGVGEAITYSLYKPIAIKDTKKCIMLMQLYKKIYHIIGIVILVLGILITPFLNHLINEMPNIKNISLIYILFVLNTSISYFFSYKRNLIIADQKRYIATIYRYGFYCILNICQIIFLLLTKNYIIFVLLQIINTLLENIFISIHADKMYPYLKLKNKLVLDKKSKIEIIKNTKAMLMHNIGRVVINSTDNIVISKFIGIIEVGIYSNYYLITNALNIIFGQFFSSLIASVGNLCVLENKDKQYDIFKKVNFINFWIYSFSSICLLCLLNPFIEIWLGSKYLFSNKVLCIIVINYYVLGMKRSVITFRNATGMFYIDRWSPVLESIINIFISIILAMKFGVFGVFLGTLISTLLVSAWIWPYNIYKLQFKKSVLYYFADYVKYLLITTILSIAMYFLCSIMKAGKLLYVILEGILITILFNVVVIIIFYKSPELKYLIKELKKCIDKIRRKK